MFVMDEGRSVRALKSSAGSSIAGKEDPPSDIIASATWNRNYTANVMRMMEKRKHQSCSVGFVFLEGRRELLNSLRAWHTINKANRVIDWYIPGIRPA